MEHSTNRRTARTTSTTHRPGDSPRGTLAKFQTRPNCRVNLDTIYRRADRLTNLTIHSATQTTARSSMRPHYEIARSPHPAWGRGELPTRMARSGADMFPTPHDGPNGNTKRPLPTCPAAAATSRTKTPRARLRRYPSPFFASRR